MLLELQMGWSINLTTWTVLQETKKWSTKHILTLLAADRMPVFLTAITLILKTSDAQIILLENIF